MRGRGRKKPPRDDLSRQSSNVATDSRSTRGGCRNDATPWTAVRSRGCGFRTETHRPSKATRKDASWRMQPRGPALPLGTSLECSPWALKPGLDRLLGPLEGSGRRSRPHADASPRRRATVEVASCGPGRYRGRTRPSWRLIDGRADVIRNASEEARGSFGPFVIRCRSSARVDDIHRQRWDPSIGEGSLNHAQRTQPGRSIPSTADGAARRRARRYRCRSSTSSPLCSRGSAITAPRSDVACRERPLRQALHLWHRRWHGHPPPSTGATSWTRSQSASVLSTPCWTIRRRCVAGCLRGGGGRAPARPAIG